MIKVGIVGFGFMGTSHLSVYREMMENGLPVQLVAICDVDIKKIEDGGTRGNISIATSEIDVAKTNLYTDMCEMIDKENLDYVDLTLPTYLHGPMAILAMKKGVHVFCEKPMSISNDVCQQMIDTSIETGKHLMIGHTLRYWNVYETAKEYIDEKKFGEVISAYFFRGGSTPIWSWENWLLTKEKSGGCLLDQHVHDVDAINWLFGMPRAVSTSGKVVINGSGYDAMSTNYIYDDGKVVNAQDDWTINGNGFGFSMLYRINFEKGALIYESDKLTIYPVEGEKFVPELSNENAYYKELRLFIETLTNQREMPFIDLLKSHKDTILIAEAEVKSADNKSQVIEI